jgi:guanosine-3',5'-bis(diphosphate) 3'-pyrophosphohydrolase
MLRQQSMPGFPRGLPKTQAAIAYASYLHEGQRRKADGAPFILHPLEVASLLYYAGAPDDVIAAGALHDTIEKTDAGVTDLRDRFGPRVAGLVLAVSEDEQISSYAQRKAALCDRAASAGEEALMLLAADKVSKARELRRNPHAAGRSRRRRVLHYRQCLQLLEERLPRSSLVRELEAELETLPDPGTEERQRKNAHAARG